MARDTSQNYASWRSELPNGWGELFDQLVVKLVRLDPEIEIAQAKEKFGEFRLYLKSYPPGAHELIDAASRASRKTCQQCGARAVLRATRQGFYATVCEAHSDGMQVVVQEPIVASFRMRADGLVRIERDPLDSKG